MNVSPESILVVDDDKDILRLVVEYLRQAEFSVSSAADGAAALQTIKNERPRLVVLDLMLPGEHGLAIARRLKNESRIPIVIVSAQGDDIDRIVGLEVGADDYLPKPFNPRELLARIRAGLRRAGSAQGTAEAPETRVVFGEFELDIGSHRLTRNGEPVALTSGEFDLLSILVSNPNKVLDRDRILDLLTGAERSPFDRSIDVRVTRLRGKIEADPSAPVFIKTVWGKGYMFCPDGDG